MSSALSTVLNIVPPVEDRPSTFAYRKYSEPLSPAAAIAASTRASPNTRSSSTSSSLATVTDILNVNDEHQSDLPVVHRPRRDKASIVLGIKHRKSMEPIPASARTSIATSRSVPNMQSSHTPHAATTPLTSLYVVSGLAKSPHTWQLADVESVLGVRHSEGAVGRFWRPEVLGSTVTPGAGGSKKKGSRKVRNDVATLGMGALPKQDVAKMLSKTLKLSFPREVEIVASTLQPASTIHTFTFNTPNSSTTSVPGAFRSSIFSSTTHNGTMTDLGLRPYDDSIVPRPSSTFLGPPPSLQDALQAKTATTPGAATDHTTYYGVCLTVWSHADEDRSAAIRRSLENAARARKESNNAPSVGSVRKHRSRPELGTPSAQVLRKRSAKGPWQPGSDAPESDIDIETEGDVDSVYDGVSESDFDGGASQGGPGGSSLFLPGDTVFWLPYALTLVSRHPIYDLMRDYLTLSWARFSKDVQSHSLQIAKILAHPAPRAGDMVRLDATSAKDKEKEGDNATLEVICRFPGGLDFGKGLLDVNFQMYPLFQCLALDNILTICEIALSPTGRVLFLSRHPQMLGIAVSTIKYLVELRGWNGIALPMVHSRDAKIYMDDPGPWIMGLGTEGRHVVRPSPEVCICDFSCAAPSPGAVSTKQQRDRYRKIILSAFDAYFHPDYAIPSEFKEAFPAGRFRPICKIQAKRGATASVVAESIKPPEWWNQPKVINAFDMVLQDKVKKPSLFRRISSFGMVKRMPQLSVAEQIAQMTIRKRATAFVDARDDLETKIGRLSRRLNFLMTESDLWREKFITFEHYAEKLSSEAAELRSKIGKEQKESKRLSSLVTITASEKFKLEEQLRETEGAHRAAIQELDDMRMNMAKMEEERAAMVAEVEAQIERALQSMMVSESEPDDHEPDGGMSPRPSRPSSRRSSVTSGTGARALRSFDTNTTLAENPEAEAAEALEAEKEKEKTDVETETKKDAEEVEPTKLKRFSATQRDMPGDGIYAVDENISERSDRISRKVMEIQQKLEDALAADVEPKSSESDQDATLVVPMRPRPNRPARLTQPPIKAKRTELPSPETPRTKFPSPPATEDYSRVSSQPPTPKNDRSFSPIQHPLTPAGTEDSDTDFQSAYSTSPRGDDDANSMDGIDLDVEDMENGVDNHKDLATWTRTRASSTATTATAIQRSPTVTDYTTLISDVPLPQSRPPNESKAKQALSSDA
ncbi:DENN domain-containing protein [Hysterangium stoloniferum]|nr:DENN domain-containing protein [Hysterangium stoloniferum]